MNSRINERFRKAYRALPKSIRQQARRSYRLFKANPNHPSLHFKRVHTTMPVYSARVNLDYRVLGILKGNTIIWFWIGSHDEYERVIGQM